MYIVRMFNINLLKRKHRYYSRSGFYGFLTRNVFKIIFILLAVIALFFVLEKWVIDLDSLFGVLFKNMSDASVFILFSVSESFFGLIPPDFFIIWARKFDHMWGIITLLAFISYSGGLISYYLGRWVRNIKSLNNYIEQKFGDHFIKIKRWGALFIIVSALFPLPYSTVCMLSGTLKFPVKVFVIIGTTRLIRFYFYALVLLGLIG